MRAILFCLISLMFLSCLFSKKITGSESGSETGKISGNVVLQDGATAANGATVDLFQLDTSNSDTANSFLNKFSVKTNSEGKYEFSDLDSGSYELFGIYIDENTKDTLTFSRINIFFTKTINLGVDTLVKPGKIRIQVLINSNPGEEVECYIPGTSYISISDKDGYCEISAIPPGEYSLNFRKDKYLKLEHTNVVVESEKTTLIDSIINLQLDPVFPPPVPTGLIVNYDSIGGIVDLHWNSVNVSDIDGYIIYRDDSGSVGETRITPDSFLVRIETYFDIVYSMIRSDTLDKAFRYRIKSQDKSGDQSGFGEFDIINVRSPKHYINNTPPEPALLQNPINKKNITTPRIDFRWVGNDKDAGNVLSYSLYVDTVNPPNNLIESGIKDELILIDSLSNGKEYYWKIVTYDRFDSSISNVGEFKINHTPNVPKLIAPYNFQNSIDTSSFLLEWEGGDSDFVDSLTYLIYMDTVSPPVHWFFIKRDSIKKVTFEINNLPSGKKYFWKIVSTDGYDSSVSVENVFYTNFNVKISKRGGIFLFEDTVSFAKHPDGDIIYNINRGPYLAYGNPFVINSSSTIFVYQMHKFNPEIRSDTMFYEFIHLPAKSEIFLNALNPNTVLIEDNVIYGDSINVLKLSGKISYSQSRMSQMNILIKSKFDSENIIIADPVRIGNLNNFDRNIPINLNQIWILNDGTMSIQSFDSLQLTWNNPFDTTKNVYRSYYIRPKRKQSDIYFTSDAMGTNVLSNLVGTENVVYIIVEDQPINPGSIGNFVIDVSNPPGLANPGNLLDSVKLSLVELLPGKYIGTLPIQRIVGGIPFPNKQDGNLQLVVGDQIYANYVDAIDGDNASFSLGYGAPNELSGNLIFIDKLGHPIDPNINWNLNEDSLYIRYTDDPGNGWPKSINLIVENTYYETKRYDTATSSLKSVSSGIWEGSIGIRDTKIMDNKNNILDIYFQAFVTGIVSSHSNNLNTEQLNGQSKSASINIDYPDSTGSILINKINDSLYRVCLNDQVYSIPDIDTVFIDEISCSLSGSQLNKFQIIQQSANSNEYCNELNIISTISCNNPDKLIVYYSDPIHHKSITRDFIINY